LPPANRIRAFAAVALLHSLRRKTIIVILRLTADILSACSLQQGDRSELEPDAK